MQITKSAFDKKFFRTKKDIEPNLGTVRVLQDQMVIDSGLYKHLMEIGKQTFGVTTFPEIVNIAFYEFVDRHGSFTSNPESEATERKTTVPLWK